jgi:hypothetical protein
MMLTHYFFQPTRYVIFAITGCNAIFDLSWLGIVLHLMWTPIQAVLSGYFAGEFPSVPSLHIQQLMDASSCDLENPQAPSPL